MNQKLAPINELNNAVSRVYHQAAGGVLTWKQEKSFFEAQIKKNWQIAQAVQNGKPGTIESLKLAARECAAMGLSMSPNAQLVYFIPRRSRKKFDNESKQEYENKTQIIVTATPSYRGLAYIAMNYAGAEQIAAEVVFAADKFEYRGPMEKPLHVPTLDNNKRTERDAIGVYALVKMQTGDYRCEYVDAPTVMKIRQMSEMPNSSMWTKLWTEGWRKVPIRRICKTVMVTEPRMAAAVESMNVIEGIVMDEPHDRHSNNAEKRGGVAGLADALGDKAVDEPEELDEPATEALALPNPAESSDPPGSIEWWWCQMNAATDLQRMDEIKVAALQDGVDRSDDADEFRRVYSDRYKELRG